jgi:hypothetical protein
LIGSLNTAASDSSGVMSRNITPGNGQLGTVRTVRTVRRNRSSGGSAGS